MTPATIYKDTHFRHLNDAADGYEIPEHFALVTDGKPHPLCIKAATLLQHYLQTQQDWQHNFGLLPGQPGTVIGKMFGVLVVKDAAGTLGYLSAFSGKLAGSNEHDRFVPPVFDLLTEGSFLNVGMQELTHINNEIRSLETADRQQFAGTIATLKTLRKAHSLRLQHEIYDHYHFLNRQGESRSLRDLFKDAGYKNPPSGAGECAGPKLLQFAFSHGMQPLAIAEFWWGQSPKSAYWQHGKYYPCCREKCEPILAHMLSGITIA